MVAKFKLISVTDWGNTKRLDFRAVTGNGNVCLDPGAENHRFWKATPSGELTMQVDNLPAVAEMKPGDEYYLDFRKAE